MNRPTEARCAVLVVDDDADIREALCDILADEGYTTAQAVDGGDALTWLRTHRSPQLVLLDWNMAPMSGPAFMTEVAQDASLSKIPVVLLTADGRIETKRLAFAFVGALKKPVEIEQLLELVEQHTRAPSATNENA